MTLSDEREVGARIAALAPRMDPPVDLVDRVRRRSRRQVGARVAGATAVIVLVAVVALGAGGLFAGSSGLPANQLRPFLDAGNQQAQRYTGPGAPDTIKNRPLWIVSQHYSPPQHTVVVAYTIAPGRPCLGRVSWPVTFEGSTPGNGSYATCVGVTGNRALDGEGDYAPFGGSAQQVGADALLYGAVPAKVRVVHATVHSGRLAEKTVATIATPADTLDRFYSFVAPGGQAHAVIADLTFYDRNGNRVGSRHIDTRPGSHHRPSIQIMILFLLITAGAIVYWVRRIRRHGSR